MKIALWLVTQVLAEICRGMIAFFYQTRGDINLKTNIASSNWTCDTGSRCHAIMAREYGTRPSSTRRALNRRPTTSTTL